MKPDVFLETMSLEEALRLWEDSFAREGADVPLPPETVPVEDALGRVTASPVSALISSPFYHAAAMDGYAVSSPETFGATETAPKRLPVGEKATYVNTGEAMPEGANAVIMVEDVNLVDGQIEFIAPVTPWQNVRTVGEDIVATELICPESHIIRPVDLGALLAGGHTEVAVRRRPRVAIIPTGDEVVAPGSALRPGNIIEFNSRVLAAMVTEWGGKPLRMDIVPDDPERLKETVRRAAGGADLIAVIAGASTGTRDHTHGVLAELGEPLAHGLRIKPGKPVMLGWAAGRPFIGVPGYPVSAYLTFGLFAEPAVRRWLGLAPAEPERLRATLSRQVASALGQEEFLRMKVGRVGGRFIATPLGRGAGLVMSLARADAMLRVEPMSEGLGAGAEVEVELLRGRGEIEHTIVSIGSHDTCMDLLANALRKSHPRYSLSVPIMISSTRYTRGRRDITHASARPLSTRAC
jgi:putative molybdopterin biosynthesis protein